MDNPLSKLTIDYWYKALMVASLVIFLMCGSGLLTEFPLVPTALISLGGFFVGLGEWRNHPLQTRLMSGTAYYPAGTLTGHPRNNSAIGIFFDIVGAVLIGIGLWKLFLG